MESAVALKLKLIVTHWKIKCLICKSPQPITHPLILVCVFVGGLQNLSYSKKHTYICILLTDPLCDHIYNSPLLNLSYLWAGVLETWWGALFVSIASMLGS